MLKILSTTALLALACAAWAMPAWAAPVQVQVTVENLAPANSIAFAPLQLGFNAGLYDSFDAGKAASDAIVSIAEGGSGGLWFPAFQAAEPNATLGTVVPNPAGPLVPGASAQAQFMVDPAMNRYFTFASMVVPSNDYFIGNDSPMQYELFDAGGQLNLASIVLTGGDLWDAGSEATDPLNAAFLQVGMNDPRTPQNGVVGFDFQDLSTFNGLTTGAGYVFNSQLSADLDVYRISFEVVPEPGSTALLALCGMLGVGLLRRGLARSSAHR